LMEIMRRQSLGIGEMRHRLCPLSHHTSVNFLTPAAKACLLFGVSHANSTACCAISRHTNTPK
jgi:hypothetical protein